MKKLLTILLLPLALVLSACGGGNGTGITFATNDVVGFQAAPNPAGGLSATFGWAEQNYAYVPTETSEGNPLLSTVTSTDGSSSVDGLSVAGSFKADADVVDTTVNLGRFFTVGQAAVQLMTGYRDKLGGMPDEVE